VSRNGECGRLSRRHATAFRRSCSCDLRRVSPSHEHRPKHLDQAVASLLASPMSCAFVNSTERHESVGSVRGIRHERKPSPDRHPSAAAAEEEAEQAARAHCGGSGARTWRARSEGAAHIFTLPQAASQAGTGTSGPVAIVNAAWTRRATLSEFHRATVDLSVLTPHPVRCSCSCGQFYPLHFRRDWPHFLAFDLLEVDGEDLRDDRCSSGSVGCAD